MQLFLLIVIVIICSIVGSIRSPAVEITEDNLHDILSSNELVLINFYVRWCRFSDQLHPIVDQLADEIRRKYSNRRNVTVAKVNCDEQPSIGEKYGVKKYPTLKLFRRGLMSKREYRSGRDFSSLLAYLDGELASAVIRRRSSDESKSFFVGHFRDERSPSFVVFEKICELVRDECSCLVSVDAGLSAETISSPATGGDGRERRFYAGNLTNEEELYYWASKECFPFVRQINFANAEELLDEGRPLLLLLHRKDDSNSLKTFQFQIEKQLRHSSDQLTLLHGDGEDFLHPLKSFGKTTSDLPLVLFDDFQQMFLFAPFEQIQTKGKLFEFVQKALEKKKSTERSPLDSFVSVGSAFVRLKASRRRYSFRDELSLNVKSLVDAMNWEGFVNWSVSIDCGVELGTYQGQIQSVDEQNQRIQLKNTFHNGILLQTDDQHSIVIDAKNIRDLNLLSQPNSTYQIAKANSKKFHSEQQSKVAPIAANQNLTKKTPVTADVRSSTTTTTNENELNEENSSSRLPSESTKPSQIQEKYRCDQMVLQHNNGPIDYEQILLPFPTTKKYLTDEGLVVPAITLQLRNELFFSSESVGYSLERRIESMGRCTSDMCLHLLGGTQRLLVKNRHQHPTIVVLATTNDYSGVYAISAARILATKNIRIHLYLSPNSTRENSLFENEFKLLRTTQAIVTNQVNELPRSPVDLVINGLDGENRRLTGERWYADVIDYCSRLQTSIIGVDPSIDSDGIECKYSLIPLLPLLGISSKHFGRLYLCDLAFGSMIFQKLNIRYSSPFGAKSFVALHEN